MKKFSELLAEVKTAKVSPVVSLPPRNMREEFVNGKIFNVGDLVECDLGIVEIISKGPNYVTVINEGKTAKRWIADIRETNQEAKPTVARLYRESITIKGYKTKNFTRELAEQFQEHYKDSTDKFALFNCTVCCDKLLGATKEEIAEQFDEMKVSFERAIKYLTKLNMSVNLEAVEDWLLEYAILEGQTFTAKDKHKVAHIIATNVGHTPVSKDPTEMLHGAIDHIKKNRYTPEAWKLMGGMFNLASKSGIKWDKDKFAKHTQRYMGLK